MDKKTRVLLILLSDYTISNLLSVHHCQPDVIIPIETVNSVNKRILEKIINSFKYSPNNQALSNINIDKSIVMENEYSFQESIQVMQRAFNLFPDAHWIVNLTGGTRPMAMSAYDFFKDKHNAKLVYLNIDKTDMFFYLKEEGYTQSQYQLSVNEYMAMYGFEPKKSDEEIAQTEQVADQLWDLSKNIAQRYAHYCMIWQSADEHYASVRKGMVMKNNHIPNLPHPLVKLLATGIGYGKGQFMDKYKMIFLTGGWLETFMYGLLKRHKTALGIQDIHIGVLPGRNEQRFKEEPGVVLVKDYSLYILKCKAGITEKLAGEQDTAGNILYKIEDLKKQLEDMKAKLYLINPSKTMLDQKSKGANTVKPHIKNRASLYDCEIIISDQIISLAENFEDPREIKKILSMK